MIGQVMSRRAAERIADMHRRAARTQMENRRRDMQLMSEDRKLKLQKRVRFHKAQLDALTAQYGHGVRPSWVSAEAAHIGSQLRWAEKMLERANRLPRLLILGHGRHGKDTVAEHLEACHGFKFTSSSEFVGHRVIWPRLKAFYASFEDMYEDRHNHRDLWYDLITQYNTPTRTRTAEEMLSEGYDMYVGMRNPEEYAACLADGVFDYTLWVERPDLPEEPSSSFGIRKTGDMHLVINDGDIGDLGRNTDAVMKKIYQDFYGE